MSSSKQRRARQQAEREQGEREQERLAPVAPRRRVLLGVLTAIVTVVLVVALVVGLTAGDDGDQSAEQPLVENTAMLDAEAASDAQDAAIAEAMAAGEVAAEDYTVEPGTPVGSGEVPPSDDRPVACGAKTPANANAPRPRYPGGPAEVLEDGVDYVAVIETSCGPITIDLLEKHAPVAVNSFVFLAEEGFYDGLEFFRDFGGVAAAHAGSGTNTADWDIGYLLPAELDLAKRQGYPIGAVTTAGQGPYTAGSEFYIAYGNEFDAGWPDRTHTMFGRVLSGMDAIYAVTKLRRLGMGAETYAKRLFIESVTIGER
jgi:cyclophilin family peptidyl-prolyl cis-trans isomerase